jgi:hypothetical protein
VPFSNRKYPLPGVLLFLLSLAVLISLGARFGNASEILYTIVPSSVCCFLSLSAVQPRFGCSIITGAAAGALGMVLGVLFGLIVMFPLTAFWHLPIWQLAALTLARAILYGLGFGASAGIFTWIIYALLKRGELADVIPLLQSCAIVLALTSAGTLLILAAEVLK